MQVLQGSDRGWGAVLWASVQAQCNRTSGLGCEAGRGTRMEHGGKGGQATMATRLAGPCGVSTCSSLAANGKRYCAACSVRVRTLSDAQRGSSAQRGYDGDWQRFRTWYLGQPDNVMCRDCRSMPARDVHHMVKVRECPSRKLDPSNCLPLCKICHQRRTNRGE